MGELLKEIHNCTLNNLIRHTFNLKSVSSYCNCFPAAEQFMYFSLQQSWGLFKVSATHSIFYHLDKNIEEFSLDLGKKKIRGKSGQWSFGVTFFLRLVKVGPSSLSRNAWPQMLVKGTIEQKSQMCTHTTH